MNSTRSTDVAAIEPCAVKSRLPLFLGLAVCSVASLFASCLFGSYGLSLAQVWAVLSGSESDPTLNAVVWQLRFARSLLAYLVGAGLAVSGFALQGVLRNPLVDPFTIGVSSGAALGASLAVFLGLAGKTAFKIAGLGLGLLPLAALAGALLALVFVLSLARFSGGIGRETLILAGIVTATFLAALISLLKALDEESAGSIVFWIMGSFQGRGLGHLAAFTPYFLIGLGLVWLFSRELDLLSLGRTQARLLGVDTSRAMLGLVAGASLMAAAGVAVSGVIGFVGLIVPHLLRLCLKGLARPLLLACGLGGGLALMWSDVLARTVLPGGAELPVGVVTALLGGPFFCLILRRGRAGAALD